jgi:hypothetical protein|tara:strand:+ start:1262 stop:1441 length:180 start_codon:yes stop_codon:yes gene_type:complete
MTKYQVVLTRTKEAISTVSAHTEELAYMKAAQRKQLPLSEFVKIYEIRKYEQKEDNGKY